MASWLKDLFEPVYHGLKNFIQPFYEAFIPEQRYLAYFKGLKVTLEISLFAILLGITIGIVVAIIKVTSNGYKGKGFLRFIFNVLNIFCNIYTTVIRGTPLALQLLIIYNLIFTAKDTNAIVVGTVCFGINSGAYVAEIIRGGIEAVDSGQTEAGRSLGFSYLQTMRYIIMPQAVKNALPAIGNELIVLVKETAVAGYIAVSDLMMVAQFIGSRTWDILPPLIIAAAFYLVIVLGLTKLLHIAERRLSQGDSY